ncbi:MAG: universal stress protein [Bacteroidota bacterium]
MVTSIKNWLIPVDFSPASRHALQYGARLAARVGGKVTLLHAYIPQIAEPYVPYYMQTALLENQEDQALTHLEALSREIPQPIRDQIQFSFKVEMGPAADTILAVAGREKVHAIVMGMRGGSPLRRMVFGSHSMRVMRRAEVPVLVVPEGVRYRAIESIAYATSMNETDIQAIESVWNFARQMGADFHCVHVRTPGAGDEERKWSILKTAYQHEAHMSEMEFARLDYDYVVDGLNDYVQENDIDLLVLMNHQHSWFSRWLHTPSTELMAKEAVVPLWAWPAFLVRKEMASSSFQGK